MNITFKISYELVWSIYLGWEGHLLRRIINVLILSVFIVMVAACENEKETAEKPKEIKSEETKGVTEKGSDEKDVPQDKKEPLQEPVAEWSGMWTRVSKFSGGSLEIVNASDQTFGFTLDVSDGGNIGQIKGSADVNKETATYSVIIGDQTCSLTFTHKNSSIFISQTDGCHTYGGNGTTFEGEYQKGNIKVKEQSLSEVKIIDKKTDALLQELTEEDYKVFVNNMQMFGSGIEDSDGWNAKIITGGVRGLYSIMEAIIIIDEKNGFLYAAAIKDGEEIVYFTNNREYADKLPKTIEVWRERFTHYPVIYMSE
jgi:hypothetical protein